MRSNSIQRVLKNTLVMVLAGGQGQRLHPLTRDRAKPAVPFGGIYRIIDFTLSNCINSGLRSVYVLTQYKSISLNRHLQLAWGNLPLELGEFVTPIPPQQRLGETWYRGTADAIFQNIYTLQQHRPELVLILAGDHVYKMNYSNMIAFHREKRADLTIACIPVDISDARRFGIMEIDHDKRIVNFVEKPANPSPLPSDASKALASMGIYVFDTETLIRALVADAKTDSSHDFGKDIVPRMVREKRVYAYEFVDENRGDVQYWRDIGTIDAYWEANMDLLQEEPLFDLYDPHWPIRTYQAQYPPAKMVLADGKRIGVAVNSLVSGGCIIRGARVERCVLSHDVKIETESHISDSVIMDGVRIGKRCRIRRAIIDKDVVVPDDASIGYDARRDSERFTVSKGGIVVVPKGMPLKDAM